MKDDVGTMYPEGRARAFSKLTALASRPWTGDVCSPLSVSLRTPVVGGCALQKPGCARVQGQPCAGETAATHRVGSSQGKRLPLWFLPGLQGRSGCAGPGHPLCGEHSWPSWKSPAQSASFSLHSCCPQGPMGSAQVGPALSKGRPHPPAASLVYTLTLLQT